MIALFYLVLQVLKLYTYVVVANVIISAVTTARPKARYVVPAVGKIMLFLRWLLSDRMFDALWCRFMKVPKIIE